MPLSSTPPRVKRGHGLQHLSSSNINSAPGTKRLCAAHRRYLWRIPTSGCTHCTATLGTCRWRDRDPGIMRACTVLSISRILPGTAWLVPVSASAEAHACAQLCASCIHWPCLCWHYTKHASSSWINLDLQHVCVVAAPWRTPRNSHSGIAVCARSGTDGLHAYQRARNPIE
jgi:hypothetical protein